ncbi:MULTISPECIES: helix-turn-helix domain-containing protein [unclassified Ruminococcus]|uniref:helix-turn-helix domain-containing protein n=1 Tax=unclassified Ruminococcus TaxID=2608920 RepID=UPI00210BD891|nr:MULTISPECIES: helix-turn-helix transcriptional regulator [unclassified Ruminococcus]
MFDFGLRIRELRENHKLSQDELGRKVGRSKSVISSYENNLKIPPLEIFTNIAVVFNVSLDYLVGIDKEEMVSVEGLSEDEKRIINIILLEFNKKSACSNGLSDRQQLILSLLMKKFLQAK